MLNQEMLKKLLHYNPETGQFTRLITVSSGAMEGDIAGTNDGDRYLRIGINGVLYSAHRLAWLYMNEEWPKNQIDHINHNGLDNRILNLREVDNVKNSQNRSLALNNTSGVTGVYFCKKSYKWISQIKIPGKRITLCRTEDKFEAICSRLSANIKYHFHINHGK